MRKHVLALAGLLVAGTAAALPVLAQAVPPPVKQRAPGVPLAPRSTELARPAPERVAPRDDRRGPGEVNAQLRPERDPPMPKPVPAIIAP